MIWAFCICSLSSWSIETFAPEIVQALAWISWPELELAPMSVTIIVTGSTSAMKPAPKTNGATTISRFMATTRARRR